MLGTRSLSEVSSDCSFMLETRALFTLSAQLERPQTTASGPYGERRYIPVFGGEFVGERLAGEVLRGGANCLLNRPDRVSEVDVRVSLQTHDGAIILMKGLGLRHGPPEVIERMAKGEPVDRSEYYFREALLFEAPRGPYEWLNRVLAVGIGERRPDMVRVEAYELL